MTSEQITVTDADRDAAWKAFENWFFRECVFGARRHLYAMFDMPLDEIRTHGDERHVLRHIRRRLQGATNHRTEGEAGVLKHAEAMAAHLDWALERIESGDVYERMCCDGHMCGCMGASKGEEVVHFGREALAAYRTDYPEKNDDQ